MESTYQRGRGFECGIILRANDDDLALFNDMQNMERDNFLLHDSDDFDDSLSKLRYLLDFKLDKTIPARGERSDLLNAEGEKNDYDWLLTPPDTPLFHSLDDDDLHPQNLPPRGRPQSQPIRILRSSSMTEKTQMTYRNSASPLRISPSSRSSTSVTQLKGRSSSAPHASPPPAVRPATPSRRPSNPPNKPSSPTSRSSTPTPRRVSTGSSAQTSSSGRRAASSLNSTRGSSASPKLRGWQADFPGFSSDAPPNLRTSLSDRSVLHVRGMSPTPRSGRGRQSMSPTASRSASSPLSHDRDLNSSFSKGSIASSGDDDLDSLHSVAISSCNPVRRNGMSTNNRPMAFSKKPSRTSSASSVPKRSSDFVIHQERHKTPQNMFRPLLSSVPAASFYVGKANSTQRPMFSRNSSPTTSTSAISEQGACFAPVIEGSEHDHNDLPGEWEKIKNPDANEEMFIFDKADDIVEDCGHENFAGRPHSSSKCFNENMTRRLDPQECNNSIINSGEAASSATATKPPCATDYFSVVDGREIMTICSKCGKRFQLVGLNGNTEICEECAKRDQLFDVETFLPVKFDSDMETERLCNEVRVSGVPESPEKSNGDGQHQQDIRQEPNFLDENCPVQLVTNQSELNISDNQLDNQPEVSAAQSDNGSKLGHMEYAANPSLRVNNPEGTGISVLLLQRSSSSKWPVVQGRAFSATNILCSEPSYVRDNSSSLVRSVGRDSASASSSTDLGSSRQSEGRIQRQLSSGKNGMASIKCDIDAKAQCTDLHPDLLGGTYEPSFQPNSVNEENFDDSSKSMDYECEPSQVPSTAEVPNEHSVSTTPEKGVSNSTPETYITDKSIHEKSTVVEGPREHIPRSLTLAEATDAILFCNSIVHDIAYKAATIGMKKHLMLSETARPTVMIVGKSVLAENDSIRMHRHTPKSQKFKRKRLETQTKLPSTELGNKVIVQGSAPSNAKIPKKPIDSTKPPNLESKCNCTVM